VKLNQKVPFAEWGGPVVVSGGVCNTPLANSERPTISHDCFNRILWEKCGDGGDEQKFKRPHFGKVSRRQLVNRPFCLLEGDKEGSVGCCKLEAFP